MIIIGIDPGIATTGYGVVNYNANKFKVLDYGAIITEAERDLPDRLNSIYDKTKNLIERFNPDVFAIEELFFNKNVKTALTVGHGRGVSILCAAQYALDIYEYTPLQVKQALTGHGRAQKSQIQQMTKVILNLDKIPKPDDVADALAIAICHAHSHTMGEGFRMR